ncbi:hypothetical protein [Sphingorhabdus sp.]|jgi:predicted small secreted protein|uniref:hypothetical protein n=1 Tax=Sphingorhabdus sp. TaxID=1902408 RepID=UPI003BAF05C6|nr:hypothetical protein [Sphingomonadales bacterium]MBL0021093.1 hypothetical protein [Sphingomonadales bacterium]
MRAIILKPKLALILSVAFAAPLALSACGSADGTGNDVEALDEKLAGKGSDPAMNAALEDRILVDPDLADSANSNMVKAPDKPLDGSTPSVDSADATLSSAEELDGAKTLRAPKPRVVAADECTDCGSNKGMTLEDLAAAQGVKRGKGTCSAKMQYGASWANRMPPEFPIYPKALIKEASGVEGGVCDIRAASFNTSADLQTVVDYYYTRARRSGYSADYEVRGGEHVLGGVRDNDGGAYVVFLNRNAGGGTSVDIVANNGR